MERGRGNKVPTSVELQACALYTKRVSAEEFLYSVEEIAMLLGLNPKTVRLILRDHCARALQKYLARRPR